MLHGACMVHARCRCEVPSRSRSSNFQQTSLPNPPNPHAQAGAHQREQGEVGAHRPVEDGRRRPRTVRPSPPLACPPARWVPRAARVPAVHAARAVGRSSRSAVRPSGLPQEHHRPASEPAGRGPARGQEAVQGGGPVCGAEAVVQVPRLDGRAHGVWSTPVHAHAQNTCAHAACMHTRAQTRARPPACSCTCSNTRMHAFICTRVYACIVQQQQQQPVPLGPASAEWCPHGCVLAQDEGPAGAPVQRRRAAGAAQQAQVCALTRGSCIYICICICTYVYISYI